MCLYPGIWWIPGSDIEISSLPPSSLLSETAGCWCTCWTYLYINQQAYFQLLLGSRIQCWLGGRQKATQSSCPSMQSPLHCLVQEMVGSQMGTSCKSPLPCGRVSPGAGYGLLATTLAKEVTCSLQKGARDGNWKQGWIFKALFPCAPVVSF